MDVEFKKATVIASDQAARDSKKKHVSVKYANLNPYTIFMCVCGCGWNEKSTGFVVLVCVCVSVGG